MKWLNALNDCVANGTACVIVTITAVEGSAPRGVGTRMLVTQHTFAGSIGGGALEFEALQAARNILDTRAITNSMSSSTLSLGRALSQCCGGKVSVQYDYHPGTVLPLVIFGAGHVAQALASMLQQLPCHTTFIDAREQWLNKLPIEATDSALPANGLHKRVLGNNPHAAVEQCDANSLYLVMTHSHELDFELVEAILTRADSTYCGLIASASKATSFRRRLHRRGFSDSELSNLTSPLGQQHATGNSPMEVAVAVLAEVLHRRHQAMQLGVQSSATQSIQHPAEQLAEPQHAHPVNNQQEPRQEIQVATKNSPAGVQ